MEYRRLEQHMDEVFGLLEKNRAVHKSLMNGVDSRKKERLYGVLLGVLEEEQDCLSSLVRETDALLQKVQAARRGGGT